MKAKTLDQLDTVDEIIQGWRKAAPDCGADALHLVGRVIVLAKILEQRVEARLAKLDLTLGQFDILGTLYRQGPLTPKQLLKSVVLSSGGMTSRLDGLADKGWIIRRPDPNDRRGVVVELTVSGKKKIECAMKVRFQEAKEASAKLTKKQTNELKQRLRTWLLQLQD